MRFHYIVNHYVVNNSVWKFSDIQLFWQIAYNQVITVLLKDKLWLLSEYWVYRVHIKHVYFV